MKIKIYQINMDRDTNGICFMSWKYLQELGLVGQDADGFRGTISKEIYDMVYVGEYDTSSLDQIYARFNTKLPEGFRGRSLSVSDIVKTPLGLFFCDTFGWVPVRWG